APTGTEGAKDIADIRDAERLPRGFPWGLPLLLAALAALWYALRRRKLRPKATFAPKAPAATPDETALARLHELETSALPSRAFAFVLWDIVRGYLAARVGVDALEATPGEVMERVEPLPLPEGRMEWLRE